MTICTIVNCFYFRRTFRSYFRKNLANMSFETYDEHDESLTSKPRKLLYRVNQILLYRFINRNESVLLQTMDCYRAYFLAADSNQLLFLRSSQWKRQLYPPMCSERERKTMDTVEASRMTCWINDPFHVRQFKVPQARLFDARDHLFYFYVIYFDNATNATQLVHERQENQFSIEILVPSFFFLLSKY